MPAIVVHLSVCLLKGEGGVSAILVSWLGFLSFQVSTGEYASENFLYYRRLYSFITFIRNKWLKLLCQSFCLESELGLKKYLCFR